VSTPAPHPYFPSPASSSSWRSLTRNTGPQQASTAATNQGFYPSLHELNHPPGQLTLVFHNPALAAGFKLPEGSVLRSLAMSLGAVDVSDDDEDSAAEVDGRIAFAEDEVRSCHSVIR
jgi:hypothetical protein